MTLMVTFAVSGQALETIRGSEMALDPVKYDGGSQDARDAFESLQNPPRQKRGKGYSYTVTTTVGGAERIEEFCRDVGETFMFDLENRPEGRALLIVARRIRRMLEAGR